MKREKKINTYENNSHIIITKRCYANAQYVWIVVFLLFLYRARFSIVLYCYPRTTRTPNNRTAEKKRNEDNHGDDRKQNILDKFSND